MKKILMSLVTLVVLSNTAFAASEVSCVGTEPFWSAKVADAALTYQSMGDAKAVRLKVVKIQQAQGLSSDVDFVVKTKYASLTVVAGECSDGMSDNMYSHHAVMSINGVVLSGCCTLK